MPTTEVMVDPLKDFLDLIYWFSHFVQGLTPNYPRDILTENQTQGQAVVIGGNSHLEMC